MNCMNASCTAAGAMSRAASRDMGAGAAAFPAILVGGSELDSPANTGNVL